MKDKNCLARGRTGGRSIGGLDFEDLGGFIVVAAGKKKGVKGWRWAVKRRWMPVKSVEDGDWSLQKMEASDSIAVAAAVPVVFGGGRRSVFLSLTEED